MAGSLYNWIQSHWEMYSWSGPKKAPYGELIRPSDVELDYADPSETPITTTIDCFITGTYIDQKGKMFTIRQRYSVTITYSSSTVVQAMARIRDRLIQKFQAENESFMVGDIFIPELQREVPFKTTPEPIYTYRGGKLWRYLTRIEEGKFKIGLQKEAYKNRARMLIAKYGLKKKEGYIRKL
jgi:hypothetical protein